MANNKWKVKDSFKDKDILLKAVGVNGDVVNLRTAPPEKLGMLSEEDKGKYLDPVGVTNVNTPAIAAVDNTVAPPVKTVAAPAKVAVPTAETVVPSIKTVGTDSEIPPVENRGFGKNDRDPLLDPNNVAVEPARAERPVSGEPEVIPVKAVVPPDKPVAKPVVKPAAKPVVKSAAKPAAKPAGKK